MAPSHHVLLLLLLLLLLGLSPAVAGAVRVSSIDQDGLADRAYRLHYNQGQNRTDVFAQV
jgi:hypothetical protein